MPPLWPRERERALLGESGSQVPGGLGHADLRDRLVPALMLQRSASSAAHAAGGGTSWRRSLHWPLPRLQNSKCPNPLSPSPPPPPVVFWSDAQLDGRCLRQRCLRQRSSSRAFFLLNMTDILHIFFRHPPARGRPHRARCGRGAGLLS
jgi:hypothetical protein